MKRKVEYIVITVLALSKYDTLENRLNQIRAQNRFHYVITPKGELINLKDAEHNNSDDTQVFEVQCVHLLFLMPQPTAFKTLFYILFCSRKVNKKMKEISALFPEAKSVNEESFYDGCFKALERKYLQSEIDVKQLEAKINDISLFQLDKIHWN